MAISATSDSILLTGATGFIGRALSHQLAASGFKVRAAVRGISPSQRFESAIEVCTIGDINAQTPWLHAVRDMNVVIHLASGVDRIAAQETSLLEQYRTVNVAGAQALVTAAAACNVRRFIYVSTIKVNGEQTAVGAPFTETDHPHPEDAYAQSKWEAEQLLDEQCRENGLMLTIVRPPIVYGPGVRGNFLALMKALERGIPLPLGSIQNQRSMIYLGNLVDSIIACVNSPVAVGKTYLVSDGEDISTPELIRKLASAMGRPPRLLPCPVALLNLGAAILGKRTEAMRLVGSLAVDSSRIRQELGWRPRYSLNQGLIDTARWYHQAQIQRGT